MSGAITQLLSLGAQDVDIGLDQKMQSFKQVFKRHTNFASFWNRLPIQGPPVAGNRSIIDIIKKGDLLSYITFKPLAAGGVPTRIQWDKQIDRIEFRIGEQVIDSMDSDYIARLAYDVESSSVDGSKGTAYHSSFAWTLQVPFWFCRGYHAALPLISITNQSIQIYVYWKSDATLTYAASSEPTTAAQNAFAGLPSPIVDLECIAHFITLDKIERDHFLNSDIKLLITQHQTIPASNTKTIDLNLSNPVKFICAHGLNTSNVFNADRANTTYQSIQISTPANNAWWSIDSKISLEINGSQVADPAHSLLTYSYISRYHHSPGSSLLKMGDDGRPDFGSWERIFLYPFCINTGSFQPTGTLNFSRISKARLVSDNAPFRTNGYAVNYNILRIEKGVAGIMFAN